MSDRVSALTVILEKDLHTDDADRLVAAIMQLRGVLSVKKKIADVTTHIAEARARADIANKLWDVLYTKENT